MKGSTALRATLRKAIEARKIVKPANSSSMRDELMARVDAMPDATVPQRDSSSPGWLSPEDEADTKSSPGTGVA